MSKHEDLNCFKRHSSLPTFYAWELYLVVLAVLGRAALDPRLDEAPVSLVATVITGSDLECCGLSIC